MHPLVASFVVGVAVAAPVGPVGVLCIQRTLRGGIPYGLASGLGVATADGLYAGLATLGIAAVTSFVRGAVMPLRAAGGVALLWLAVLAWRGAGEACDAALAPSARGLAGAYGSTFALTLANPTTVMSFAAIMAGLGAGVADPGDGLLFMGGVMLGSLAWWVFLASAVGLARARAPRALVGGAGRVSAAVLALAGAAALWAALAAYVG